MKLQFQSRKLKMIMEQLIKWERQAQKRRKLEAQLKELKKDDIHNMEKISKLVKKLSDMKR